MYRSTIDKVVRLLVQTMRIHAPYTCE